MAVLQKVETRGDSEAVFSFHLSSSLIMSIHYSFIVKQTSKYLMTTYRVNGCHLTHLS